MEFNCVVFMLLEKFGIILENCQHISTTLVIRCLYTKRFFDLGSLTRYYFLFSRILATNASIFCVLSAHSAICCVVDREYQILLFRRNDVFYFLNNISLYM